MENKTIIKSIARSVRNIGMEFYFVDGEIFKYRLLYCQWENYRFPNAIAVFQMCFGIVF